MTEYTPDIDISIATRQQMFDFMLNHLRNQGGPSVKDPTGEDIGDSACMYRGKNGSMCAIGCMIPDNSYDANLEGLPAPECICKVGVTLDSETQDFLEVAQAKLHDGIAYVKLDTFLMHLEKNAIELTEEYQLAYTPPVEQDRTMTEQKDADDEYLTWGDMTPEAKGALLLAAHNGAVVQEWSNGWKLWQITDCSRRYNDTKYRVKPADPVVVTHELFGRHKLFWSGAYVEGDTHKVTYNIIDGVIYCASIQMMEIDK